MTENPVYRCEELEDSVSVYDIIEENDVAAIMEEKPDNVYLEILSDETEERDRGTTPQLPVPRPETEPQDQDRGYEDLEDKKPDHVYLELLYDETQGCDQAEDQVQYTDAEYQDTNTPD